VFHQTGRGRGEGAIGREEGLFLHAGLQQREVAPVLLDHVTQHQILQYKFQQGEAGQLASAGRLIEAVGSMEQLLMLLAVSVQLGVFQLGQNGLFIVEVAGCQGQQGLEVLMKLVCILFHGQHAVEQLVGQGKQLAMAGGRSRGSVSSPAASGWLPLA